MQNYDFKTIEETAQKIWREQEVFKTTFPSEKEKFYVLDMFPYPSGDGLHVGHVKGYTATDVVAHYKRLKGYNVLHPMGWDAFGLPAENYAIKVKKNPSLVVEENIRRFKSQLQSLGFSYDWSREINTTDPNYYKWTQWIFLKLFKRNLAYQAEIPINFCPSCKTGLANEEVVSGQCERCGTSVVKKNLKQWILKITEYADRLLEDIDELNWPEPIKEMQRNWIGRSEGAKIDFRILPEKKFNYILIPGYNENSKSAFFPKLKNELESLGHSVFLSDLPDYQNPKEEEQVDFLMKNVTLDENTIVIGHSLGGIVAMKLLEKAGKRIHELYLVAPAINPTYPGVKPRPYWENFSFDVDFEKMKSLTNHRTVISDIKEGAEAKHEKLRFNYLKLLSEQTASKLVEINSEKEHFVGENENTLINQLVQNIEVFTTRSDTLFGCTYVVTAPEHELIEKCKSSITNYDEVKNYIGNVKNKSELERTQLQKEKSGIEVKGIKAINPINNEQIPLYVADYVLGHYGTGAVMAVPAHDERDFDFAKKYNIEIRWVIGPVDQKDKAYTNLGTLENSGKYTGKSSKEAMELITNDLAEIGKGLKSVNFKLRDWIFSRQRYWGEPIPIVHCQKCGIVPVDENDLPVVLPQIENYEPSGDGSSPLSRVEEWVKTKCPKCGGDGKRETNTMPQWAGSCWYYLRYCDPNNSNMPIYPENDEYFSPVDFYVGGAEHAVLHLLYARFYHKVLFDESIVKDKEPFKKLQNVGLILAPDRQKMSKSRGNVINPDDLVKLHGADSLRMYEMFIGPFDQSAVWSKNGIVGTRKFLEKVFFAWQERKVSENDSTDKKLNILINSVDEKIEKLSLNTAVSDFMKFSNEVTLQTMTDQQWKNFLITLSPFAPHLCEYIFSHFQERSVFLQQWPKTDILQEEECSYIVQVNGKTKFLIQVGLNLEKNSILDIIYSSEKGKNLPQSQQIKNVIFIKNKLINLVF
ncbi:MAG: Leucine--tRNA ligase [candidate division WS2 bacterium ADurb.Bin280]|uniref:Leucine--tRNA ligase n=1 Tax=candidate division WS2 bacterium ADurb.Bin280 TaxID=1852829 RepID=A0A1V5SCM4_9BACT|nr:MAG: Leucine--tRNA ligase [candidate division WS2 bacterium ADurb.Bin280]